MDNADFEDFLDYCKNLPALKDSSEWHLTKVLEIACINKSKLNEILRKGIGFDVETDHFTPIEKDYTLAGAERNFLKNEKTAVLFLLQFEALWRSNQFAGDKMLSFNIDYMDMLTTLLIDAELHGALESRPLKSLHSVTRQWFIDLTEINH